MNVTDIKPRKTYFDIIDEWVALMDAVESVDGELTEELEAALAINEEDRNNKIIAYRYRINQADAKIALFKQYKAEFDAKIKKQEKLVDKLKEVCTDALLRFGEKTYDKKTGEFKNYVLQADEFKLINVYTKPLVITDEKAIPDEYKVRMVKMNETSFDTIPKDIVISSTQDIPKDPIKQALKDGKAVPGAEIDNDANYLRWY